jgi:predicted alpha/beta-fold hydrolase
VVDSISHNWRVNRMGSRGSLAGPAGRLEALVNEGAPAAPFAALICHPHPLGGGSMHNKVVYHAMKVLNDPQWGLGWPVLRFNFRGTGLSQGVHDGHAEAGDVLAAIEWLENEFRLPLVVVGFSFGAMMALSACCSPARCPAKHPRPGPPRPSHSTPITQDFHYTLPPQLHASPSFSSAEQTTLRSPADRN